MNNLVLILTWFHIFFVIGWFGSFLYTFFVLFPMLSKLSPQSGKEFMFKLLPSHEFYSILFSTGAIVAGIVLFLELYQMEGSVWFSHIMVGIVVGLAAYVLMLLSMSSMYKMRKGLKSIIDNPQVFPPPPAKSMLYLLVISFALLLIAMSFMVLAAAS